MCDYDGHHIAASRYLSEAKKRNKELKKLKSVSRAYRKSQVRGLKADAAREQAIMEAKMAEQMAKVEAINAAHNYFYRPDVRSAYEPATNGLFGRIFG